MGPTNLSHWPSIGTNWGIGSGGTSESPKFKMTTSWKELDWCDYMERWIKGWDGKLKISNISQEKVDEIKVWLYDNLPMKVFCGILVRKQYKLEYTAGGIGGFDVEITFADRDDATLFKMWLSE